MKRIGLVVLRSRLLEEERWAADEATGDLATAQRRLAENARLLGVDWLPGWARLLFDGSLRGLRTYQTLNYKLPPSVQWVTWPLIGLLSAGGLLGYVLGEGPAWLAAAAFGPGLAASAAAGGAIFEIGRAIFGSSNRGRLAAAGASGLIVLGTLTASVIWFDRGGRLSVVNLLLAALVGLVAGVAFEAVILLALGRLFRSPRRGAT